MSDLDAPRETTVRKLFALSSNRCAHPECQTAIVDRDTGTILGEICHICARKEGGPRFDPGQTTEQRRSIENLMLMCGVHHKLVDADENLSHYSVERLREIKTKHEALSQSTRSDTSLSAEALTALLETVRATAVPTTHMDFRGALINAGGHGGGPAGGGGGGGIIHVVGVTPASFREKVEVDGKPGKFPGGGGGGGGSIVFSGRLVSKDDIEHGLRVSCFLFANAAEVRNGLLYLLGAGWETFPVGVLPQDACVGVAGVIDTGTVVPSTLLALAIVVEDPSGRVAASDPFDLEVADAMRPIMRQCFRKAVRFRVTQPGVWRFTLRSGDIDLAESSLDIKVKG